MKMYKSPAQQLFDVSMARMNDSLYDFKMEQQHRFDFMNRQSPLQHVSDWQAVRDTEQRRRFEVRLDPPMWHTKKAWEW